MSRSEEEFDCAPENSAQRPEAETAGPGEGLVFPCSSAQKRFWFLNAVNPGNPALNVALRWEVTGRLAPATAEQAFQAIIDRHEILRTRFFEREDGEPMQEALAQLAFRLSVIDLSMLGESEQAREALALGEREARKSFDLAAAPPIRATFLRLSPERAYLLVTVHHIAFDGWSIRVLAEEFGTIAAAIAARSVADLPPLPLQYGDYCLWQKEYLASGEFEEEAGYWKKQLGGAPYFELVPDHEKPPALTYNGEILAAILPAELGDRMEAFARGHNLTLFSLGCAVLGAMLHRFSGESDIVFGTQIADRNDPDLEPMIGMFVNNLVMRLDASGDPSFEAFLERVKGTAQDALINQRMPFDKLVELLNPPRDPSRAPLISLNFTVLRDVMDHKRYGDFELLGLPSLSAGSLYDIFFFLVHWPSGWRVAMEYNPDLFQHETAEKLLDFLVATFDFAVGHPQQKLSDLTPPRRDLIDARRRGDELGAIEAALLQHPDVREAAVALKPDSSGRERPCAYIAPRPESRAPLESLPGVLAAHLDAILPSGAARPAGISVLLALPRTARGDVDLRGLPAPAPSVAPPVAAAAEAALTPVEMRLGKIWSDLLKVDAIKPSSNFFELGGHSLLTVRLMSRVSAEFGVKLDPLTLFLAPTLREFAARLPKLPGSEPTQRLVQIQPLGHKTTIIAINHSVLYYNLARQIGTDRPFIGIPLIEPGSDEPRERTLEEIAVDYVNAIREAQPHGPYILCGLCVAGAIAYESAQQLIAAGEEVPLLILSDIWAPGYHASLPLHRKLIYQFNYRLHTLRHRINSVRTGAASLAEMLSSFTLVRKSRLLEVLAYLGLVDGDKLLRKVIDHDEWRFLFSLEEARNAYQIRPISSDVILFNSDEIVTRFADPNMGWSQLVKKLTIHAIRGWHQDIFRDEGAREIAGYLRPELEKIDSEHRAPARSSTG
ncbi:condensation domain-containing protein [Methylocella silvestris]|uniref:Carrier domain-containing protein n=1 Tax=Methylocella silvestris TaxID=199596 RepID=A0A2J7TGN9_METSI|nr:condensation domain-containing protein [Methylocella silvestris]PNG25930.1 hypothetical protein CR492_11450 [Methylocella silvestris]